MGQTLEYRGLKPGTHVILVIVSDGKGADGDEFTIVIKKPAKKDSPGFGVVVAFVALMLAMVHTVRRLDRRW
jgi:PGF-CTERM protein